MRVVARVPVRLEEVDLPNPRISRPYRSDLKTAIRMCAGYSQYSPDLPVEAEFAHDDTVAIFVIGQVGQIASRLQHEDGQRQVECRSVFRYVGRREVDQDLDLGIGDNRRQPFISFRR